MTYRYLDTDNWLRKAQFQFFKKYQNPFFNMCSLLDVTELLNQTRISKLSFSSSILFASIFMANKIDEFKYRLKGDKVIICDNIYAGSTVLLDDNTFGFFYVDFFDNYLAFQQMYENEILITKNNHMNKLKVINNHSFDPRSEEVNMIHYSVIPWISFTSFSHPRTYGTNDSIPKIVFGKYYQDSKGNMLMPISIEVHHALMDGYHMGLYLSRLQQFIANPEFLKS